MKIKNDLLDQNLKSDGKVFSIIQKSEKRLEDRLKKLDLKNEELIFVIGAGISMNYGLKSWSGLADELIQEIHKLGLMSSEKLMVLSNQEDLKKKITIAKQKLGKRYLEKLKEECSYSKEEISKNENKSHPLKILKNIDESHQNVKYITTNIDSLVEDYLKIPPNRVAVGVEKKEDTKIYKIHGCINHLFEKNNKMVFTPLEYIKFYGDNTNTAILKEITKKAVVIFIGKEIESEIVQTLLSEKSEYCEIYLFKAYKGLKPFELLANLELDIDFFNQYGKITLLPFFNYEYLSEYLEKIVVENLNKYSGKIIGRINRLEFEDSDFEDSKILEIIEEELKRRYSLEKLNFSEAEKEKLQILLKNIEKILLNSSGGAKIFIKIINELKGEKGVEEVWKKLLK